jgi:hypothetical protein
LAFSGTDRLVFVALYRLAPGILDALKILKPETVIRWHRAGLRGWKSRSRGGRPATPAEVRQLIRQMSVANPIWGAPRIHGELLKLGIDVGQTTVAKYMVKRRRPPSQGWKTFPRNHANGIASMDLFVVPTISFRLLYGSLILRQAGCDRSSKCRMDCPSTDRGLRLAGSAAIHRLRSRWCLWGSVHPAPSSDGHTGSTDLGAVAMAKRLCGEVDRLDPAGLP